MASPPLAGINISTPALIHAANLWTSAMCARPTDVVRCIASYDLPRWPRGSSSGRSAATLPGLLGAARINRRAEARPPGLPRGDAGSELRGVFRWRGCWRRFLDPLYGFSCCLAAGRRAALASSRRDQGRTGISSTDRVDGISFTVHPRYL
jgi:hypothetical protein